MAEPTSALTFYELIREVAEFLGVASYRSNGRIIVPTDQFEFEYCKRVVNEAIRRFVLDAPPKGWRWMRRLASITFNVAGTGALNISSDAARYMLPEDFGGTVDGPIRYAASTSHGGEINWIDESFIRARRANTVFTGYPAYAAVRAYQPVAPTLTAARRWELVVDPQPSAADTVEFPYTMHFNALKAELGTATGAGSATTLVDSAREEPDDWFNGWKISIIDGTGAGSYALVTDYTASTGTFTVADWLKADGSASGVDPTTGSIYYVEPVGNSHPAGFMHDQVILSACKATAEGKATDGRLGQMFTGVYASRDLPAAYSVDRRSAPRTLGSLYDGRGMLERHWNTVTTDHDV